MASVARFVRNPAARPQIRRGLEAGLRDAVEFLGERSQELDPDLTGAMEASRTSSTDGLRGAVSYSDIAAVYQHERLDFHHDNGQAKFLEVAVNSNAAAGGARIAAAARVG